MRHRFAVFNWLQASYRLAQVVSHHAARSGPAVRGRHSTGEVVATISNDAMRAGGAFDITARLSGAVVAYAVVAVILLASSPALGIVVLVGVPVLVFALSFVVKPLQERQRVQRDEVGKLTALGADTASGLRVLRGIGGELAFLSRYRNRSQGVRHAGVRVALPQSTLDAAQVFIPGLFVVLVTWLGARFAPRGGSGRESWSRFTATPRSSSFRSGHPRRPWTRSRVLVGARRMLDVLEVEPHVTDPDEPAPAPPTGSPARPGLRHRDRARRPDLHRVPPRRGRGDRRSTRAFRGGDGVVLGDVRLADLPLDAVRRRIVVSEADPVLFSGKLRPSSTRGAAPATTRSSRRSRSRTPRTCSSSFGRARYDRRRARPLVLRRTAPAPGARPRAVVRGRGARPRRADERRRRPHEARIANRLHEARAGRTTVVVTTSPLMLDRADRVVYLRDCRAVAVGATGSAQRARGLPRDGYAGGGSVSELLPIADGLELRAQARVLARRHRLALAGTVALHAAAAAAGLAGPPLMGNLVQSAGGHDQRPRRPRHLVLAAFLVLQTILTFFARRPRSCCPS